MDMHLKSQKNIFCQTLEVNLKGGKQPSEHNLVLIINHIIRVISARNR